MLEISGRIVYTGSIEKARKNPMERRTLKASDPLTWVGLMNTCKAQAEEVILAELIYA